MRYFVWLITLNIFMALHIPLAMAETAGCAADTWRALNNRAQMLIRRDDVVTEASFPVGQDGTPSMPVSVLQLMCFEEGLQRSVDLAGAFSGAPEPNPRYDGSEVARGLAPILADHQRYLEQNGYLQAPLGYGGPGTEARRVADSTCVRIRELFESSRCENFEGRFYTMEDLIDPASDPRGESCGGAGITQTMIDIDENRNFIHIGYSGETYDPLRGSAGVGGTCINDTVFLSSRSYYIRVADGPEGEHRHTEGGYCVDPNCTFRWLDGSPRCE